MYFSFMSISDVEKNPEIIYASQTQIKKWIKMEEVLSEVERRKLTITHDDGPGCWIIRDTCGKLAEDVSLLRALEKI